MRHLDSCLKEIDVEVLEKGHDNHEKFGVMKEMNAIKISTRDNLIHDKQHSALNLSLNATTTTAVNDDQDENNNGTDDNTFESSSSFPSITSEQQPSSQPQDTTPASFKKTKNDKRNIRECIEKTDESISIGLTPSKRARPKSNDEKFIKTMVRIFNFTIFC